MRMAKPAGTVSRVEASSSGGSTTGALVWLTLMVGDTIVGKGSVEVINDDGVGKELEVATTAG